MIIPAADDEHRGDAQRRAEPRPAGDLRCLGERCLSGSDPAGTEGVGQGEGHEEVEGQHQPQRDGDGPGDGAAVLVDELSERRQPGEAGEGEEEEARGLEDPEDAP